MITENIINVQTKKGLDFTLVKTSMIVDNFSHFPA